MQDNELKTLTCIVCPNGCTLTVDTSDGSFKVSGNKCPRGASFATAELTCPMRTICSTVRTVFKEAPVVPVRVSKEIPKDKIFDVMNEINKVTVDKRLGTGDIVIPDVLGLGADIIITSDLLKGDISYEQTI